MAKVSAVALSLALLISIPAVAKAPTAKIALTGPGIADSIELTHRDVISANVWGGNFIDKQTGVVAAPAAELPRYTVQFHVQLGNEVRMMYVVYYVWDEAAGRALLQVPDVSDKWYELNVSAISRCCHGKWFYASRAWGEAIHAALPPPPSNKGWRTQGLYSSFRRTSSGYFVSAQRYPRFGWHNCGARLMA